jgi:hypothetical protein
MFTRAGPVPPFRTAEGEGGGTAFCARAGADFDGFGQKLAFSRRRLAFASVARGRGRNEAGNEAELDVLRIVRAVPRAIGRVRGPARFGGNGEEIDEVPGDDQLELLVLTERTGQSSPRR